MHLMKRIVGSSLVVLAMSTLAGCNTVKGTVEGAGKDIQAVSNTVTSNSTTPKRKVYRHRRTVKQSTTSGTQNTSATASTTTQNADGQTTQTTTTETKTY